MAASANIELVGTSSLVEAETSTDNALFVDARPQALDGFGAYSVAVSTGTVVFSGTGSFPLALFSFRWTHPTARCVIRRIWFNVVTIAAPTTVTSEFSFQTVVARNYRTNATGGTAVSLAGTGHDQKMRTSMPPTAMQAADLRISTTAPLGNGNWDLDTTQGVAANAGLSYMPGWPGVTTPGSWFLGNYPGLIPVHDFTGVGHPPLTLSRFEGVIINYLPSGPADGSFVMVVQIEWQEVGQY